MAKNNNIMIGVAVLVGGFLIYEEFLKGKTQVPINPNTGLPVTSVPAAYSTPTTTTSVLTTLASAASAIKSLFGGASAALPAGYNNSGAPSSASDIVKAYQPTQQYTPGIDTGSFAEQTYEDPADAAPDQIDIGPSAGAAIGANRFLN